MNYREMNRLAAMLCGVVGFGVILMIGYTTFDLSETRDTVNFYFN